MSQHCKESRRKRPLVLPCSYMVLLVLVRRSSAGLVTRHPCRWKWPSELSKAKLIQRWRQFCRLCGGCLAVRSMLAQAQLQEVKERLAREKASRLVEAEEKLEQAEPPFMRWLLPQDL